jgi:hypothetical protein
MTLWWKQLTALVILTGCLAAQAHAQVSSGIRALQRERDEILARQRQQNPGEMDATRTKYALDQVFKVYPPSLKQVLQFDSSLLSNKAYLAAYPKLSEFLDQHPVVARDPAFFIGVPKPASSSPARPTTPTVVYRGLDNLALTLFMLGIIGAIALLINSTIRHQRWMRLAKERGDAQAKILDRFTSNEELLNFIQTPAGRHFLESSSAPAQPKPVSAPISQILWSVQAGMVLLAGGIGLEIVGPDAGELGSGIFHILGTLVIAVGIGFILSGFSSYILSKKFGLMNSPDATSQTPPS